MARLDFANLTRFRAALTAPILDHCAWPAPCADDQACVRVGSCTESDAIDQWVPSLHTSRNWLVCCTTYRRARLPWPACSPHPPDRKQQARGTCPCQGHTDAHPKEGRMSSRIANETWFLHIDALALHSISAKSEQTAQSGPKWALACRVEDAVTITCRRIAWSIINPVLLSWVANGICLLDFAIWPAVWSVHCRRSAQISPGRDSWNGNRVVVRLGHVRCIDGRCESVGASSARLGQR